MRLSPMAMALLNIEYDLGLPTLACAESTPDGSSDGLFQKEQAPVAHPPEYSESAKTGPLSSASVFLYPKERTCSFLLP